MELTKTPINSPICCFEGVAPTKNPVFRSCDVSPAIADAIQTIPPTVMAEIIPVIPVIPAAFNIIVVNSNVAIVIPDMGFDELPTTPTILEDTVTKKNANIAIIDAPINPVGICGKNAIKRIAVNIKNKTIFIGKSLSVLFIFCDDMFVCRF